MAARLRSGACMVAMVAKTSRSSSVYAVASVRAATGDADVLAPLPAPQDELRRSDEYEESFEEEN